jgi:mannonate dehydratase
MTAAMINLPISGAIVLGAPGREADVETACACIAAAGEAGVGTVRYAFRALRPSAGYYVRHGAGRGGADLRAFDLDRVRDLPPIEGIGTQSKEALWERLLSFLERAVSAAEAAGVRLAVHPSDPPPPVFRGVAQPLATLPDLERLVEAVDSPANTIVAHPGVFTEMGEDAPSAIRSFGERGRIGAVHFRNVRAEVPYERYVETFTDDGDCDMFACMRALHETGFAGMVDPDHAPGIAGDTEQQRLSWALAVGGLLTLRNAADGVWGPARER